MHIQRSSGNEPWVVYLELLVHMPKQEVVLVRRAHCIPRYGVIQPNGQTGSRQMDANYIICRGGVEGYCSHCLVAIAMVQTGGPNKSTTKDYMYWILARESHISFPKDIHPADPFFRLGHGRHLYIPVCY